jgi:hypothetical protein
MASIAIYVYQAFTRPLVVMGHPEISSMPQWSMAIRLPGLVNVYIDSY